MTGVLLSGFAFGVVTAGVAWWTIEYVVRLYRDADPQRCPTCRQLR